MRLSFLAACVSLLVLLDIAWIAFEYRPGSGFTQQYEAVTGCGPWSLGVAALRLGVSASDKDIARMCDANTGVVSFDELSGAARGLGLETKLVKCSWNQLVDHDGTAVLFVDGGHFLACDPREMKLKATDSLNNAVRVYNIGEPARWYTEFDLCRRWSGETLLLSADEPKIAGSGWETLYHDFGVVTSAEKPATYTFRLKDAVQKERGFRVLHTSCGCTTARVVESSDDIVGVDVTVGVDASAEGSFSERVLVLAGPAAEGIITLHVSGVFDSSQQSLYEQD
jgi:hypothetical protein